MAFEEKLSVADEASVEQYQAEKEKRATSKSKLCFSVLLLFS